SLQKYATSGNSITLVSQGKATSAIMLANKPTRAANKASNILQSYIEKISGVKLKILHEKQINIKRNGKRLIGSYKGEKIQSFILVGNSKLAKSYGFNPSRLKYDGYVLRTFSNVLLIAGHDKDKSKHLSGTRNAANGFLERCLGVRWLWPGKLGTVIPHD